jgi:catechol-2,3-dioxygenase
MTTAAATRFTTGHVGLNVSDLGRAARFYQEVFGFEVTARSDEPGREYAFLAQDGELVLTLWRQSSGRAAADRPGLHHLSFRVASLDQVRELEGRLRARSAVIHHDGIVAHREGAESGGLFFEDPDGIRLEVFAPAGLFEHPAPHGAAPTCGFF